MPVLKSGLAALLLVAGLSASALAQQKPDSLGATGAYPASQVSENLSAYYGMTPNFANHGLSGTYPGYGGYGYQGYGPGAQFGAHYASSPASKPSTTSRNPPGFTSGVPKRPTGRGTSAPKGVSTPRKGL
jgi:hypothetical protein